jgi:hypothetical protein
MPKRELEGALYVRLPAAAADKLDRAAEVLGVHKKDLVAGLVTKYVDPDSKRGLSALGSLSQPKRFTIELSDNRPTLGTYSFQPHEPPEVLNAAQAAELLQLEEKQLVELAEAANVPGRKLGKEWRFSRAALIAWLAGKPG